MAEQSTKYALCEVNDIRDDLKIAATDTSYDEVIRRLINGVSAALEGYCGRVFMARDFTAQKYDGDGTGELLLRHIPVISITSLVVDDVTITSTQYVVYNDTGKVMFTDGNVFTLGPQMAVFAYRAGFERQDLPGDILMAARTWVCHAFKITDKQRWGVGSQSTNDESFSFALGTMPPEVREIADMYRVWR